jgi:hypothetical protein
MRKELFDEVIGEVPPSTVDVSAAIARGRRAARLSRLGSPVAVAGVAVALVTGGVALAVQSGQGMRAGDGGNATGPCGEELPTGPAPTEPPAAAAERLSSVLTAAVTSRLEAGATLARFDGASTPPLDFTHLKTDGGPTERGSCVVGEDEFVAEANVVRGTVTGTVAASVARSVGTAPTCADRAASSSEQTDCEERTGPRGERVMASTLALAGGIFMYRVDLDRTDGTTVVMWVKDAPNDDRGSAPGSGHMPLSRDQLVEVALDPALTLYP